MKFNFKSIFCLFAILGTNVTAYAVDVSRCPDRIVLNYSGINRLWAPDSTMSQYPELVQAWKDLENVRDLAFDVELTATNKNTGTCTYSGSGVQGILYSAWGAEDTLDFGKVRAKVTAYSKTEMVLANDANSRAILGVALFCASGDCGMGGYPVGYASRVSSVVSVN